MCEIRLVAKSFPTDPGPLAKVLANKAGVSPSYASELANNRRWPSLQMAVKLKRKVGIPPEFWVDRGKPEQKQRAA
jgi:plasmid maintenance system antidote protein VapI